MTRVLGLSPVSLGACAAFIAGSLLLTEPWRWVAVVILAVLMAAAWRMDDRAGIRVSAIGILVIAPAGFVPISSVWLAAGIAAATPMLRQVLPHPVWRSPGSFDAVTRRVMVATVLVATAALWIWAETQRGSAGRLRLDDETTLERVIEQAQQIPWWIFPLAALTFAVLNAAAEEFVYRGLVLEALLPAGPTAAVFWQAIVFGAIHLNGFPGGWWGVAMTSVYGAALGWLRIRSGSLAAPFLVHAAADFFIAYLVRFGYG